MTYRDVEVMGSFVQKYAKGKVRVLDVGSLMVTGQDLCFRRLSEDWEYIGIDVASGDNVNIVVNEPYNWEELESNSFDIVISANVFEHIEFPWITITEIARVLKPDGFACIIAPLVCPTHGYPVDTFRYNVDGLAALAKWAKLDVVELGTFEWNWNPELPCLSSRIIMRKS